MEKYRHRGHYFWPSFVQTEFCFALMFPFKLGKIWSYQRTKSSLKLLNVSRDLISLETFKGSYEPNRPRHIWSFPGNKFTLKHLKLFGIYMNPDILKTFQGPNCAGQIWKFPGTKSSWNQLELPRTKIKADTLEALKEPNWLKDLSFMGTKKTRRE